MLTKKDVLRLYDEGLEIKFRRKRNPEKLKGDYDPASQQINIYLPHIASGQERDITILHEFIHARDDGKIVVSKNSCSAGVEREAIRTYTNRPYVLALIKELYNI